MKLTLDNESIQKIYLGWGKKKLETDVDDICDVIFTYLKDRFQTLNQDFGFGTDHAGAIYCYDNMGQRLEGDDSSMKIQEAIIKLYPIISEKTLMKPIPKSLAETTTEQSPSQNQ
jgi:hypothetical protein